MKDKINDSIARLILLIMGSAGIFFSVKLGVYSNKIHFEDLVVKSNILLVASILLFLFGFIFFAAGVIGDN